MAVAAQVDAVRYACRGTKTGVSLATSQRVCMIIDAKKRWQAVGIDFTARWQQVAVTAHVDVVSLQQASSE